ncbi:hypothetical protein G5I_12221 [Acromyrmex echinatior]|uniref:Uncharacterized protein n=1 Tax=Acromyrmex echinatior TaxID=103372 RepID=F4X1Q3_ACREC|nr:hypothetical protein G5I_12221 [Acromyrmex echinatior]
MLEEVNFEEIMDQEIDSDEEILSDNTGYASDLSEHIDYVERFVLSLEICALNGRTKHCIIYCYYTTGGALSICAACMVRLTDIDIAGLYLVEYFATLVEYFAWLQRCDECIERLEELCRAKRLAVGYRQSVVARIARLAGAKLQLERRFVHVGGEYASGEYASGEYASRDERSLVWREIDAAFESRISVL